MRDENRERVQSAFEMHPTSDKNTQDKRDLVVSMRSCPPQFVGHFDSHVSAVLSARCVRSTA